MAAPVCGCHGNGQMVMWTRSPSLSPPTARGSGRQLSLRMPRRLLLTSWFPAQPIWSRWCPGGVSWRTRKRWSSGQVRCRHKAVTSFHVLSSHPTCIPSAAPAQPSLLSLTPLSSDGLLLTWAPPAGHWDNYRLQLLDGSHLVVVDVVLGPASVNFSFPKLTPGRTYRAILSVESGGMTAASSCDGSTGWPCLLAQKNLLLYFWFYVADTYVGSLPLQHLWCLNLNSPIKLLP